MEVHGVASYFEIDTELEVGRRNLKLLDLHLRYVMNPELCMRKLEEMGKVGLMQVVSRPLFEVVSVKNRSKTPLMKGKQK